MDGKEVILYRIQETSPELLKVDKNEFIKFLTYDDFTKLKEALTQSLLDDIGKEKFYLLTLCLLIWMLLVMVVDYQFIWQVY